MPGFLQRLKQRKLVQWALAYVAFAFALLQGIDIVAQQFGWPESVRRGITIALVVGFFVVLVLAWYHGERGEQRVSGVELLIIALVLAIGGGVLWHFSRTSGKAFVTNGVLAAHKPGTRSTPEPAATTWATPIAPAIAPPPVPAKSVAVLPFENLSADMNNAYFADGMQDLILTKLADIGDLKVISRTATAKYKSHPDDLPDIARQLGVATFLEGSVQKAGNQVLINVQLIDASTNAHLWAQSYQRTLDNIFGVEGEVAEKVATALNAKLSASESAAITRVPTRNKVAYEAYLKAGYFLNDSNRTGDAGELAESIKLTKQAVAADPEFADAWALLALGYQKIGHHVEEATQAARKALALDPGSANAHVEYAFALMNRHQFEPAIAQATEALRLKPKGYGTNNALGFVYLGTGQIDEAAAAFARTVPLFPQDNFARKNLAAVRTMQRQYAAARDGFAYVVARDPADIVAATGLAQAHELGWADLDAARRALQGVPTPVATSGALSDAWYWLDLYARDYGAALAAIGHAPATWFEQQGQPLALYQARVYRAQGDTAMAKEAFARARDEASAQIKIHPDNAMLHASLALASAGLGDRAVAVTEAQRALKLPHVFFGDQLQVALAVVQAWTGDDDAACMLLAELLAKPAGDTVSVSILKLDPAWDPIRHDPAFQALLKKYGDRQPATATSVAGRD